ncbi:TCDD-inducible poly [ADP-ribose] polymerase [Pelobates cultripes]|uniref:TCDD-inducible poly [ADP-ribose] polymerase n=1 Tax=Pelobates cultripes TaxID=61616 RepID=A0AAD1RBP3_PELCU|nr:TCDD-inducible poly [ADP-ribose] polymerase [Pelobates cultripes]
MVSDMVEESSEMAMDTESEDPSSNATHATTISDRHFLRHPDKIPPVKPCFKKKQTSKLLDADTLRALRPIFSSFLGSGTLNEIFVPGNANNLCDPHVKKALEVEQQDPQDDSLISANPSLDPGMDHTPSVSSTQKDITEEPPSVIETEPTFPTESSSVIAANTANEAFEDSLLQANPSDSARPDCLDKTAGTCSEGLFQNIACLDQYNLNQANSNTGIFQDKTDEASLLLVFELLNQLQYHVHLKDGIEICVDFLQGLCFYGKDCPNHHTVLPYHWQVRKSDTGIWQSLNDDSQEHVERLYCSPDSDRIKMRYQGHEFIVDLNCMSIYESLVFDQIRRLSTPCTSTEINNYHTVWKYFCRDHFGWREYSEPVVKLIEEANVRGLKEVRFVTWHNQYILNIKDGFQQNACFRKEIKRRPLFRSPVLLLPHLQKKEFMTRKMTGLDKIMNERHLFHGTSQDVVDGICKHNFDPRVCGKHATMFGQGSYFARKASYSHSFSKRSPKGVHYMFLAKVLTGRYVVGNHTMRRPPPLNPASITSDLYDSCVDNFFDPQIFVIFNDDQSYPYFIIQYEELSTTVSI